MELRHLRYFAAVAETSSLSRAAEKLFVAQPPLSVQIRQLEDELGTPLFTRHPKGVRLTAAGQALLPEARFLLERVAGLRERVNAAGDASSLAIGFVPSTSSTVLPELLRSLRRTHPRLQIELREMISSEQVEALVAGHVDVGLARAPARHARVVVACEMPDPFCLAVPADDVLAGAAAIDLKHGATRSFVGFTRHRGPAYFDQAIHLCSQAGFSPHMRYEASTVHGVLDLVGAGMGVALVPASSALLGVEGAVIRPLRRSQRGEMLSLLRRKAEPHPLMPSLEAAVARVFGQLQQRVERLLAAPPAARRKGAR